MKTIKEQGNLPTNRFEAKLLKIGSWTLLRLPKSASAKLPSRGMTMVKGTINGYRFQAVLEPDGRGSHWYKVDDAMLKALKIKAGDIVSVGLEHTKEWIEPEVPSDLKNALEDSPKANALWLDITPNARWDWV